MIDMECYGKLFSSSQHLDDILSSMTNFFPLLFLMFCGVSFIVDISEQEYIQQPLPPMDRIEEERFPEPNPPDLLPTAPSPTSVRLWKEFLPLVRAMDLDCKPLYRAPDFSESELYGQKRQFVYRFIELLGSLRRLPPYARTRSALEWTRGRPDVECFKQIVGADKTTKDVNMFPIVIKRSLDVASSNLVGNYSREEEARQGTMTGSPASMALRQTYAYMRLNGFRYGVLSTVKQTWFFMRTARGLDDISISPAITDDQSSPSLLQCYLWLIRQASDDSWELDPPSEQVVVRWEQETPITSEKGLVLVSDLLLSDIYTRAVNHPNRRIIFLSSKKNWILECQVGLAPRPRAPPPLHWCCPPSMSSPSHCG